jgi:chloramphenicol-sensitive protein RarD
MQGVHAQDPLGPKPADQQRDGMVVLLFVYISWGLLPIYWKQLTHVSPLEVLCHRSLWGFLLVLALLWGRGAFREVRSVLSDRRTLKFMVGCSAAHMFGWGFYIWAIANGLILEASLGSYILPLLSAVAGYAFFRERPRRLQWFAIAIAGTGVLGMVLCYGTLPWAALLMGGNSVLFAVLRKHAPVNAVPGLVVEMLLSGPILWGYLIWLHATGQGTLGAASLEADLWLMGAGIVTVLPQLGYAYGLNRVPLTTLSLLQYIPPTGTFLVGVYLFGEKFSPDRILGFTCIWIGLVIFTLEGYRHYRRHSHALTFSPVRYDEGKDDS